MLNNLKNPNISNNEIISILKSNEVIKHSYEQKVRHYFLEQHTLLVLNEFSKYFAEQESLPIEKSLLKFLLAVHDIGKPKAFRLGNKENQNIYTIEIINQIRNIVPFTSNEIDTCICIINGDPIGMFFQNKISVNEAKSQIISMNKHSKMSMALFFKTLTIYYQCDTGSYTYDAGGQRFLEYLFDYSNGRKTYNNANGLLKFSVNFEIKYKELIKQLLNE